MFASKNPGSCPRISLPLEAFLKASAVDVRVCILTLSTPILTVSASIRSFISYLAMLLEFEIGLLLNLDWYTLSTFGTVSLPNSTLFSLLIYLIVLFEV